MPVAGGGFEQCYNAQAVVAADSLLVIAADVVQAPNDKQQLEPMLGKIAELPERTGQGRDVAGGQRLFQRGQRECLRRGGDRSADRDGPGERIIPRSPNVSPPIRRRRRTPRRSKRWTIACKTHGGQEALRVAQADARTGVRHHQIGAGLPPVPAAWPRQCARRVEPRDHGLEHEADVRSWRARSEPRTPPLGAYWRTDRPAVRNDLNRANCVNIRQAPPPARCRPAEMQPVPDKPSPTSLRQMGWTAPNGISVPRYGS